MDGVEPDFDVYMLGKLLWCMVSGKQRLPREYQRREGYDLTSMFPEEPLMEGINNLLDKCIVEHP